MSRLFLDIFNLSITASWLIAAVLVIRLLLKKHAPKWTLCLLWAIVGLRLIIPFSFESEIGVIPSDEAIKPDAVYTETASQDKNTVNNDNTTGEIELQKPTMAIPYPAEKAEEYKEVEYVEFGIEAVDDRINSALNSDTNGESEGNANPLRALTNAASVIWVVGMLAMLLYAVANYALLHRRVAESVPDGEVRRCGSVGSPFILGLFRPRIYLPFGLSKDVEEQVIAHEKAHLKRCDHLIKPFGYLLLTVYWFNPLVWAAYILLCRDIELACDEKVLKNMNAEARKAYASALLECGIKRSSIAACPVAFGEIGVKSRVKNAINYKKPMFWIIIAAIVACVGLFVFFITSPSSDVQDETSDASDVSESVMSEDISETDDRSQDVSASDESESDENTEIAFSEYCIENCDPEYDLGNVNTGTFTAKTSEELKAIGEKIGGADFEAFINDIPDEYFETKTLLMACIGGSSSYEYSIKGIKMTDEKIDMTVEVFVPFEFTDDMNYRMVIAAVNKADINEELRFAVIVETVNEESTDESDGESIAPNDESTGTGENGEANKDDVEEIKKPDTSTESENTSKPSSTSKDESSDGGNDSSTNAGNNNSTSGGNSTTGTTSKSVPFDEYILEDDVAYNKSSEFKSTYGDVCVIKSASELETLKSYFKKPYVNVNPFIDFANSVPDSFFEENMLLITTLDLPTLGYDLDIVEIITKDNTVTLKYTYSSVGAEATAVQSNIIIAAINKSAVKGCSEYRSEFFETKYNLTERDVAFTAHYFRANNLDAYGYKTEKVYLTQIKSYMDMQGFLATHSELDLGKDFYAFASNLDHDYFEEKSLLIFSVTSGSGENKYEIDGIHLYPELSRLTVKVSRNTNGVSDDMLYLLMVAEIDFDDMFGIDADTAVANVGPYTGYDEWQAVQSASVWINGKNVTVDSYAAIDVLYRRCYVPLLTVLEAAGAEIEWQSDTKAIVKLEGIECIADLNAKTFTDAATGKNAFDIYYVGYKPEICEVINGDLILDGRYISSFIHKYTGLQYTLDYEQFRINFITR